MNYKDFKPALFFLGKFLLVYLVLNTLYGLYISQYENEPDPVTKAVTINAVQLLELLGFDASVGSTATSFVPVYLGEERTVSVFEGCNSLNVIITMLAFLAAYKGPWRSYSWFIPLSILIIYLFNLVRIDLLVFVSHYRPEYMYFIHKYLFTAFIYAVVFALWFWWVKRLAR